MNNNTDMKLKNYFEETASDWIQYERPAVDWMITDNGEINRRLIRTMHDFPKFAEVVKQIPRPLTRQMIFDCYKEDLYKGYVATLLWDNFCVQPFPIYLYLPFLATAAKEVREKLTMVQDHIKKGDMSLVELFTAMNDPSQLQLAPKINWSRFSLALDFLSCSSTQSPHPLMFCSRMMMIHCALLLEEIGESQPFYNFIDRVSFKDNIMPPECYLDYCQRIGDIALWAGSGNPEFLVDWLYYSEDSHHVYQLARDIIVQSRIKMMA